eukprot:9042977-Pyramimonas_sp.AAC.1
MVSRLKEAADRKEIMRLLLGFHIRFWHAPVPDMMVFLEERGLLDKDLGSSRYHGMHRMYGTQRPRAPTDKTTRRNHSSASIQSS